MNDSELDRMLKAARPPERSAEYWERFPGRVVSRLQWKRAAGRPERRPWLPRLAWGLATVAMCVLAGFELGHWRGRTETAADGLLQNQKVIKEMLALFPNRVRAVVQNEKGLSLVLSDKDDVPASAPLWVRITEGRHSSTLVTFSGQEVELAGQKVTVLADARGGVVLMGRDFVWSNSGLTGTGGNLKIEARNLGSVTM
jgi:hypothetical protein